LEYLDIWDNLITSVSAGMLSGLKNLISLDLFFNHISLIENYAFNDLKNLSALDLSSNYLEDASNYTFIGLDNLVLLEIYDLFFSLKPNTFSFLPNLLVLYLSNNL
jgi:hypothetical protein